MLTPQEKLKHSERMKKNYKEKSDDYKQRAKEWKKANPETLLSAICYLKNHGS